MRDLLSSLVTTAALTNEAIQLAQEQMSTLRPLAVHAGAGKELLDRVGKLCAGKHPGAEVLKRARKKVGFHWDTDLIKPSVREYERNEKIVWLELDAQSHPVHRLAADVLAYTLLREVVNQAEGVKALALQEAMSHVDDALRIIIEFFTACVYGYLKSCDVTRRTRKVKKRDTRKAGRRRARTRRRS